ncbi:MAG: transposase [Desulfovibrio sp.]|nr:transposase [Desulfovibrio sp.]
MEIIRTAARKRWTSAQRMSIVEESMKPGKSVSRVA